MKKIKISKWDKFWILTIIKEVEQIWIYRYFEVKCRCWIIKKVQLINLRRWNTTSCGCLQRKITSERFNIHWMSKDKFNQTYRNIIDRCDNIKSNWYHRYWWRWIRNEWKTFEKFKIDMYESYIKHIKEFWKKQTTIDRINNDWNYCKKNCKWATHTEQHNNKSTNRTYKWKTIGEWCKELWLNRNTISTRINRDWKLIKEALGLTN